MEPITLDEIFMAAAAGEYDGELPEPVTRFQYYMKKIAEGAAVKPEDIDAAIEAYLNSHDADIVTEAELTQALAGYYDKTAIDTALGGKAATDHNHSGVYAPASHTHTKSQITDLANAVASTNGVGGSAGLMSAADKEKLDGINIVVLTQAQYDAIASPDSGTLYLIPEEAEA